MDSASAIPPGFRIAEVSGPLLVGYLFHWGLFGALTIQICKFHFRKFERASAAFADLYFEAFPNDRLFNKYLVYGIYIVELAQTIFVTYDAFTNFGSGFGNFEALTNMHFHWLTVPLMSGLVAFVGQSFYAYRIHIVSKSWAIPILVVAVALTSTVGAIIDGVFCFIAGDITRLDNQRTSTAVWVWGGGSAACDILISVCMTYYLAKSDTGFRQTRALISKLIRLTIETGSITGTITVCLITFFAFPGHAYYATPTLITSKLYANTTLAVLNSRFQILGGRATYISTSDMTNITFLRPGETGTSGGRSNAYNRSSPVVAINKEVFTDRNGENLEMKATHFQAAFPRGCICLNKTCPRYQTY
ncbi:hypothetical protein C8J57DRAFT_1720691 [Mycena rebaudengoi]|nr:hypothetical protein C8J57DRAFT_1720691 [Mycena rebaudengoi]